MKWNTKKLMAILLVAVMMLSLTACGGSDTSSNASSTSNSSGNTSSETTDNQVYTMDIALGNNELSLNYQFMVYLKERVEEQIGDRLQITIYPNGSLCAQTDELTTMLTGGVDAAFSMMTSIESFNPLETYLWIPFLYSYAPSADNIDNSLLKAIAHDETIQGILDAHAEEAGFHRLGFLPAQSGNYLIANNSKPVTTKADMKNLKIRNAGGTMADLMFNGFELSGMFIPFAEFPIALEQGVCEGMSSSINYTYDYGLATKYLTLHFNAIYPTAVYCNQDWWNSLPADIQAALESAMSDTIDYACDKTAEYEMECLAKWESEGGQFDQLNLSDPETAEAVETMRQAGIDYYLENYGEDAPKVIERYYELAAEYDFK